MKRRILWIIAGLVVMLSVISAPYLWMQWKVTRPVTPHVQLIFGQPRACTLYLPYALPQDIKFVRISHTTITRGGIVHEINVSGTGSIQFRDVIIEVGPNEITVNGQPLAGVGCSYVLDGSGKMTAGAIPTYY